MIKITCSKCGKNLEAPEEAAGEKGRCPDCGEVFEVGKTAEAEAVNLGEKRYTCRERSNYPVLASISIACKILAWINFVAAILLFIHVWAHMPGEVVVPGMISVVIVPRAPLAIPILIAGVMAFVFFYAIAECIRVFLDIELNTRQAADTAEDTLEILKLRKNDSGWTSL